MRAIIIMLSFLFLMSGNSLAHVLKTKRIIQISNNQVKVWQTIIYPSHHQLLPKHRHEHDRVLVALTDGTLKVMNDKGQSHELSLLKDHAYYLKKDVPGELHTDENISHYPIKVLVIELQSEK